VGDEYCEIGFGTGAVKMTPAHDPNDFEVGLRHNLEVIRVIADDGHINENGGPYNGMDRYECRKAIVKDLEEQGYLVKVEPYNHNVGTCYRCHNDVEPLISAQWFVKMEPLAKEALRVVNEGEVKFVPEHFSKTYTNWMENCHDWCISRQLWWGHQIPAWTCEDCGHINVKREDPTACEKCGSTHLTREEDVLDTWFSSALWPFSTLGWPEQTADLNYWYPTSVMVTGYDIIFFWVARMIFSGCEQMKKIPFHTVLIHGLVRDDKGRKMSKSLGNGIDPLEMAEKYGADALRFNLITGNSPGNDTRFYTEKCEAMRNFANKIWNASRFVMMNLTIDRYELPAADKLEREDKWVLSKLNRLVKEVTENLDSFEIGVASAKVYDFIWDTYCDWYIELTKTRLNGTDEDAKLTAQNVLCYVLVTLLKLLHPFMPFITEEIYQALPKCDGAEDILMTAQWPEYTETLSFPAEESAMEAVMDLIRAIRARRAEMNVPPSKKAELMIVTDQAEPYQQGLHFIQRLAYASNVTFPETAPADVTGLVSVVTHDATAYLPLSELVDLAAERERIAKELEKAKNGLRITEGKLANEKFVAHAPENVVNAEREKVAKYQELIAKLEESAKAMA
ncbi:valine--tRNA ligase, partial [Dysosmobacter sp.]|uniref:valine--tRNA ligase n=1 Tax=Dysosmobacter sp. TaxID=2591382 RepID=UPI00307D24F0